MELTDVLSLVKAGYTREEIAQMEKPQLSDPNPEPVQMQMQIPVPVAEPANPPAQVAEPVAVADAVPPSVQRRHSLLWQSLCSLLRN